LLAAEVRGGYLGVLHIVQELHGLLQAQQQTAKKKWLHQNPSNGVSQGDGAASATCKRAGARRAPWQPGPTCVQAAGSLQQKYGLGGVKKRPCFQENAQQHGFRLSAGTHYSNSVSIQPDI